MKITYLSLLISTGILFACASEKDHLITFQTRHGDMVAILYDETPLHKDNFIELAESGRYDSTDFQRVIKDFMVQGGDVFGKENLPQEEWYTIPSEFNDKFIHEKGSIAAARQGDNINPEQRSSGSQFYIVQGRVYKPEELTTDMERLQEVFIKYLQLGSNQLLKEKYEGLYYQGDFEGMTSLMIEQKNELENFFNIDLNKSVSPQQLEAYTTIGGTPHLDVGYTVFGKIIDGLEVVDKIANEETSGQDRPISPVYMKVTVNEMLKKEITKKYGYEYPNPLE